MHLHFECFGYKYIIKHRASSPSFSQSTIVTMLKHPTSTFRNIVHHGIRLCVLVVVLIVETHFATAQAEVNVNQLLNSSAPAIVQVQGVYWIKVKIPDRYKDITDDPVYRSLSSIVTGTSNLGAAQVQAPIIKKRITGTGFIISANGMIATNYQWIKNAHEIMVILTDQRNFKANVTRTDTKNDLAILKIRANNLPSLSLAHQVEEGEGVIAVGAQRRGTSVGVIVSTPAQTPASGLVSDVDVTPANSGGPLLNINGQVLGINSTRMKTALNLFRHPLLGKLSSDNPDTPEVFNAVANIGLSARNLNDDQYAALNLPSVAGAIVTQVRPGSLADSSGLLKNDVIVGLENQAIVDANDLQALTDFLRLDQKARLTVYRAGEKVNLNLVDPKSTSKTSSWSWRKLGLRVRILTTAQKNALDLKSGVVITEVQGSALNEGLQAGDLIMSINQTPLNTPNQLNLLAQNLEDQAAVVVYIIRGDIRQFVTLTAQNAPE